MWSFFSPESCYSLTKEELDLLKPYIVQAVKIHSRDETIDTILAKMFISEGEGRAYLSFSNLTEEEVGFFDKIGGALFTLQNKLIVTESNPGRLTIRHRPLDFYATKPLDFDALDKEIYVGFRVIDHFTFDWAINKLKKLYPEVEITHTASYEGINLK